MNNNNSFIFQNYFLILNLINIMEVYKKKIVLRWKMEGWICNMRYLKFVSLFRMFERNIIYLTTKCIIINYIQYFLWLIRLIKE